MCMYPRLNAASSSPAAAAASKSLNASASSRSTPRPMRRRYPRCLCASGTPRAARSSSMKICSFPFSSWSSLTHRASLSRSRSNPGDRGSWKSSFFSASFAASSATGLIHPSAVSHFGPASTSAGAPLAWYTLSATASRASEEPISPETTSAVLAHAFGSALAGCAPSTGREDQLTVP
eukprot:30865-Pelagococcus_subviridis.AAC.14